MSLLSAVATLDEVLQWILGMLDLDDEYDYSELHYGSSFDSEVSTDGSDLGDISDCNRTVVFVIDPKLTSCMMQQTC